MKGYKSQDRFDAATSVAAANSFQSKQAANSRAVAVMQQKSGNRGEGASMDATPIQLQEDEELAQGKFAIQRQEDEDLMQGEFPLQRQEDEEPLQGKFAIQRQEDEELAQGKFAIQRKEDEEPLQGKFAVQRQEDEDLMQGKFPLQRQEGSAPASSNGMPGHVQSKMESAFNTDFSGVNVHSNSSKATDVGALAYTQGTDIHFAPGQYSPGTSEGNKLLGHELTHVVQQSEGRVQPTGEVGGMPLNDNSGLEAEADRMGSKVG